MQRVLTALRPDPFALALLGTVVIASVAQAGVIVLPMMIFHQLQLLFCAVLARRYARRRIEPAGYTALREAER